MREKVCRRCRLISNGNICPDCRSTDLSDDFSGLVVIIDPENSAIAKAMKIKKKGRYAIRVR